MITSNSGIINLRLLFAFLLLVNFSNTKAQVLVADINQAKGGETPVKFLVNESQLFFTTATERGPQSRIYETYNEADDAQLIFDLEDYEYGLWIEHATIIDSIIFLSTLSFDSSFFLTLNVNSNRLRKVTSTYYDGHSGLDLDNFVKLNNKVFFTLKNVIYLHDLVTSEISTIPYPNNQGYPLRLTAYLDKIVFVNRLKESDEIWTIDETSHLTKRIFSLNKTQSFNINQYTDNRPNFIQSNDVFFFVAPSDEYGFELYQSDGTEEGTSLLLDFNPGPESGIFNFALLDDKLLLNTIDSNDVADLVTYEITTGELETYTHNFNGIGMREIQKVISAEELTYMHVKTEEEGLELWRSDGTAEGTFLLKDINEGPGSALHRNYQFQVIGNILYFAADDGINGLELWITDGSKENTRLVKDIYKGSDGSGLRSLTNYNQKAYFIAESLEEGFNIFSSDGQAENTNSTGLLTPVGTASSSPNRFTEVNDRLVFLAHTNCTGREIFSTQGGAESTALLKHIGKGKAGISYYPQETVVSQNFHYFLSHEGESNFNIFRTNGTTGGTELFLSYTNSQEQELDIYHPWVLGAVNDVLLFSDVNTMGEHYLYKVDKDSAKVTIVKELLGIPFSTWGFYQLSDDLTLWIDNDSKNKNFLMKTDGSAGGTVAIKEFDGQDIYTAHVINGLLYFLNDGKLWRSDGSEEGTFKLNIHSQDIVSYTSSSSEDVFFNSRNLVYRTDGTKEGTSALSATMLETGASLNRIKSVGENLVFTYGTYEESVLRFNMVFYSLENNSWTNLDIGPNNFHFAIEFEDRLYFMNHDSIHGGELWTSDGTTENTYMISDINPGPGHFNPSDFYVYQDWIYFSANSGDGNGRELYKYSPYDKDNDGYLPEDDADDSDPTVNVSDPNDPKDLTVDCFEIISYTDETEPAAPKLHIYPNPVSDHLNIEFVNKEEHQVEIYNLTGRLFSSNRMQDGSQSLDVSQLNNGYYLLRVQSNESSASYLMKFIVAK